jgi:hypothetical protein
MDIIKLKNPSLLYMIQNNIKANNQDKSITTKFGNKMPFKWFYKDIFLYKLWNCFTFLIIIYSYCILIIPFVKIDF